MTVKQIQSPRRYVGLSTDTKPVPGSTDTMPIGSLFKEEDTGIESQWDGYRWVADPLSDPRIVDRLDMIIDELRELKELHMNVAAHL